MDGRWAPDNFNEISTDDLWMLYGQIRDVLLFRIESERESLVQKLARLKGEDVNPAAAQRRDQRRPYPQVIPRYRSLTTPTLMWSGRGKRPNWLVEEMKHGKNLSEFLITKKQ